MKEGNVLKLEFFWLQLTKILTKFSLSKIKSNISPGAQIVLPAFDLLSISYFCFLLCWPYCLAG